MNETYETSGLTYVNTVDYSEDYLIYGLEPNTKDIIFIYETLFFTARTLNNIIQWINGQRITDPTSTGLAPTKEEFQIRNEMKDQFNQYPQPLQDWIDNLPS